MQNRRRLHLKIPDCRRALAALCGLFLFAGLSVAATDAAPKRTYDLPGGDASAALKLFSQQSGLGIIAGTDVIKGVRTNAVRGELTAAEALERMLDGTGLVGSEDRKSGTFAVRKATDSEKKRPKGGAPHARRPPATRSE